jgi:2'-hydroxyisoflavone reductase
MKILILGGTRFLGRALVHSAQSRGHQLTLFNRGKSNPGLFPEVEHLVGDRAVDLSPLKGRQWDAVIDTCGYEPAVVRRSAEFLAGAVYQYTFISSISVYADLSQPGATESAPVAQLPEGAPETFVMENYGPLKALCEQAAEQSLPGRVLTIRPGLIVGEYDSTDRFSYWPWRVSLGGQVLAPGRPEHPTQFIDVRDLADWIIHLAEAGQMGIYHATGPQNLLSIGDLLEACRQVSGSDARFTWLSEEFLLSNNAQPWTELPLWLPESDSSVTGMDRVDIGKAVNAELTFRPLADTIRSTLEWVKSRPANHEWKAGLSLEREKELLEKAAERQ